MNFFGHLIPPLLVFWDFIRPWTKFSKISFKAYWEHQTFSSSPLGTLWKPYMAKMDFCRLFGASFPTLSKTYQSLVGSCQTLNIFFSKSPAKPIGLVWLSLDIFSEAKKNWKPLYNFLGPLTPNSSKSIQKPVGSHCVPGGSNGCVHWAPSMHLTMYMILHQTFGASLPIFFGHNGTQWTHRLPLVEGVFTFNYRIYTKIFSIFFSKTFFCFDSGLPKFSTGSVWPPAPPIFLVVSEYLGHHFFLWLVGYSICCPTTTFGS